MTLLFGIIGMIFIVVAFVLDEWVKKFNQETVQYNIMNIIGSGLLTYYAFTINSWPFIILNVIWCATAIFKLAKIVRK